jgi:hypothetical protein
LRAASKRSLSRLTVSGAAAIERHPPRLGTRSEMSDISVMSRASIRRLTASGAFPIGVQLIGRWGNVNRLTGRRSRDRNLPPRHKDTKMVPDGNVLRTLGGLGVPFDSPPVARSGQALGGSIPVSGPSARDWAGDRLEVVLLQKPERGQERPLRPVLRQRLLRVPE